MVKSKNLFGEEIVRIESFTEKGKFYEVNKIRKTCNCLAFKKWGKNMMCKHLKKVLGIKDVVSKMNDSVSKSLLKSALQKAVRKGEAEKAVRIAKEFLRIDQKDFMRRFPIIIIEDVLLHPRFDRIIELLKKVGKNDFLSEDEQEEMLDIVYEIAKSEWRDDRLDEYDIWYNDVEGMESEKVYTERYSEIHDLPQKQQDLLDSIKYRASIGGMRCDVIMLNIFFKLWLKRFIKKEWDIKKMESYFKKSNLKYKDIGKLQRNDILLEAVDQHCSPLLRILLRKNYVNELIRKYFPEVKTDDGVEEVLDDIVWRQMSSVNYKKELNTSRVRNWYEKGNDAKADFCKEEYIYSKMSVEIGNIQNWFLGKQFNK